MITRKRAAKQVIANERLEGLKVSKEAKAITDNYIAGKLSAKEAAKKPRPLWSAINLAKFVDPYIDPKTHILRNIVGVSQKKLLSRD